MTHYKLTDNPEIVVRVDDNTSIIKGHRWWQDYLEWLAEGDTPEPADPPPKKLTPAEEVGQRLTTDKTSKALNAFLAKKFNMTKKQVLDAIKAEAG